MVDLKFKWWDGEDGLTLVAHKDFERSFWLSSVSLYSNSYWDKKEPTFVKVHGTRSGGSSSSKVVVAAAAAALWGNVK